MAAEASCRLIKEVVNEASDEQMMLDSDSASSQQLWQRETGFLEMFLAYFYECGRHTSAAKSYRDFLFEVLSLHQKVANKSRNDAATRDPKPKSMFQLQDIKKEVASPFDEGAALGQSYESGEPPFIYAAPLDALPPDVYNSGDTVAEEILVSLKSQEDPNGNLAVSMDVGLDPVPGSERLLPCLICLKWFAPEERGQHQCVPSCVQPKSEDPDSPPEPLERLSPDPDLLRHPSRKRFKCRHCEKSFDSAYKLNRHGRIHSGERPFPCAHCSKKFSRKEHRSRHLQQVHLEVQPVPCFPCDYCERFFKSAQAKMFHERTHTARSEFEPDEPVP